MAQTSSGHAAQPSRVTEAIEVCRTIIASLDKGGSMSVALRQSGRLAELTDDQFMKAYTRLALKPRPDKSELKAALTKVSRKRDAEASGIYRYFEDFTVSGEPLGRQLVLGGQISLGLLQRSAPEAETFAVATRKKLKQTLAEQSLSESVSEAEAVVERVRNRAYRYATTTLNRLLFAEVPERIIEETRLEVDRFLADRCPGAAKNSR